MEMTSPSGQSFWQTPAAIAATPAKLGELLKRREEFRAQFAVDLEKRAHQLPDDLLRQLRSIVLPQPKVTVVPSGDAELDGWARQTLRPLIASWHLRLVREFGSRELRIPDEIKVRFSADMGGNSVQTSSDEIVINAEWARKRLENEVPGVVIHELMYLVQQYKNNYPSWLQQGLADYVRWYLFEGSESACDFPDWNSGEVRYDGSYRYTANFLNWVSKKHGSSVIKKLNTECRAGRYREGLWQELTGRSAADLGAEWKASKGKVL